MSQVNVLRAKPEYAANAEIITMLKGMGVDYAQGYGISEAKRILMTAAAVNG